jgi:hypothetical protein
MFDAQPRERDIAKNFVCDIGSDHCEHQVAVMAQPFD